MFDVGLGKQMDFPCHEAWQGQMAWEDKRFRQDWVHLGKVANATFVNPRNQQNWTFQDLVMQTILLDAPLSVVSSFEVLNMSTKVEIKTGKLPM